MSIERAWADLLGSRRNDFVGGEIEHVEKPEGAYRGPIVSLSIEDNRLVVVTEWTAHVNVNAAGLPVGGWHKEEREGATTFTYDLADGITSKPSDIGDGRIFFLYPFSHITLFPAGGSQLDRTRVMGL